VGILRRTISVAGLPMKIGGVTFVVTEPEYRSRGFASHLTGHAVGFLRDRLNLSFGLLTCKPRLGSFYTRLGWQVVEGPTFFDQPAGRRGCGGLTMMIECGKETWPPGEIDLLGLPW
jgi:GNAT superfamily N-acetyltransferase